MSRGQIRNDRITLAAISAFALFCSTIVFLIDPQSFERFLGSLHPAMAFLAETVFHLVPLVVLLLLFDRMSGDGRWIWPALLLSATIEPVFQVVLAAPENAGLSLRDIWVGFLVAYSFRVAYYLLWHVAWGFLRIQVLFERDSLNLAPETIGKNLPSLCRTHKKRLTVPIHNHLVI